ncbi:cellulase-like family protein [Streptomonospora litoralis]|uniref:Sugar-binding cellulase-like protein n=1 Tax=Streptomonospora litoralis TaxID=2498135 RepID=A0A4P6Q6M5_9ACTN|nr:cellulase-like family protein [Streptomonospora litoralis]QBI54574.1 Sugar-binding cellulase-like protein [Streptomonospora litoralis]
MTETGPVRAITMWDFSWLERRWPGAGYEDWDRALDELVERGYDAVRIDPYPHLLAADAAAEWELLPIWDQHDWGAPGRIGVRVEPALTDFVAACARRGVAVALSSWFRPDTTGRHRDLRSPADLAAIWTATLDRLAEAGLLGSLLYVDLCNEYPLQLWAPWLGREDDPSRLEPDVHRWMTESLAAVRESHPGLPYCFSFATELRNWSRQDVSALDLLEPHVWMAHPEVSDFHDQVGYDLEACTFDPRQFAALVAGGEALYRSRPEHWNALLRSAVADMARWSRATGKPLVTTEAWAVINYKDWPRADWGWVKELCEIGVEEALRTGRWAAVCTSNFCGPQFVGMWRDVAWHRRLTDRIRGAPAEVSLTTAG